MKAIWYGVVSVEKNNGSIRTIQNWFFHGLFETHREALTAGRSGVFGDWPKSEGWSEFNAAVYRVEDDFVKEAAELISEAAAV